MTGTPPEDYIPVGDFSVTPLRGRRVVKFLAWPDFVGEHTEISPPGPLDENHHGAFRIPQGRTVSVRVHAACADPFWVQPRAEYLRWEGNEVFSTVAEEVIGRPIQMDEAWRVINGFSRVPEPDATHWRPWFRATMSDPRLGNPVRVPIDTVIYFEAAYVPDNGLPLGDQPYLDGDQPGAVWEGVRHLSTSSYGDPTLTLYLNESLILQQQGASA